MTSDPQYGMKVHDASALRVEHELSNRSTEHAIVQMAIDQPVWGPVRVVNDLRKQG